MSITKRFLGALSVVAVAVAAPTSALACGGGPATAAELRALDAVTEHPAQVAPEARSATRSRHHASGRRTARAASSRHTR